MATADFDDEDAIGLDVEVAVAAHPPIANRHTDIAASVSFETNVVMEAPILIYE